MLVITASKDTYIIVKVRGHEPFRIFVREAEAGSVRLAFEAPRDTVDIVRSNAVRKEPK